MPGDPFLPRIAGVAILLVFSSLLAPSLSGPEHEPQWTTTTDVSLTRSDLTLSGAYGNIPLRFEPNRGQTDAQVKFLSRGKGYTLFLTGSEAVLSLTGGKPAVVRMSLAGANPRPEMGGLDPQAGRSHYFLGSGSWTDVPHYGRVRYAAVYPGIDLIYHGRAGRLEYDFVVAPGADPARIRLRFGDVEGLRVDGKGDLVGSVTGREFRHLAPVVYQESEDGRRTIAGTYRLRGRNEVSFSLGPYDRGKPLVIDPTLAYATFLGGSGTEYGYAIAVDPAGNAYVAGSTASANFPTVNPLQAARAGSLDAFVAKLNSSGTAIVYATYIGGKTTDSTSSAVQQAAYGVAVDSSGAAYVTGGTNAKDFPTTPSAYQRTPVIFGYMNAFVLKLGPFGNQLLYSTLLHGNYNANVRAIAVDSQGSAYVTGSARDSDFPLTAGSFRPSNPSYTCAFVTKFNPGGSALVYSALLGGSSPNGETDGYGIAIDSSGNAYVTGVTSATDFPLQNPFQSTNRNAPWPGGNAFVTKLNISGSALLYSTYLGGTAFAAGRAIAVDTLGSAYVTGVTRGDFPLQDPIRGTYGGGLHGEGDGFVSKLSPAGTSLLYSTYLGGRDTDQATGIAVDATGNAYVTGFTYSLDFPVINAVQPILGGSDRNVFKSTDGGATWIPQTLPGAGVSVTALAISNGPPKAVFAGTGSGRIYKTTDGGVTWNRSDSGISGAPVNTLAVDPLNASLLYAGTSSGVYRSLDGGATWSALNQGITDAFVNALVVNPTSSNVLYAATGAVTSVGVPYPGHIFRSTNGGAQWTEVYSGIKAVRSLAIDPDTPSIVYAGTAGGTMMQSLNGGVDWPAPTGSGISGNVMINAIAVPRGSPGTVYLALGAWYGSSFFACRATFSGNTVNSYCPGGAGPSPGTAIAVHPTIPQTLWVGSKYTGVLKSVDEATTFTPASNGLLLTRIHALALDPAAPDTLYAAAEATAPDAFLSVLNPAGNGFVYSTYLGGSDVENLRGDITPGYTLDGNTGVAVDSSGNAYVAGDTRSADLPTTPGAPQRTIGGDRDVFVLKISTLCSYSLSPQSIPFSAAGGSGTITVTAGTGCSWAASSNASWISIPAGAVGNGNGAVNFSVAANLGTFSRSGAITAGGQTVTIPQSGASSCGYLVSPASFPFSALGGSGTVNVTTGPGCTWQATSEVTWATIGTVISTPPESGSVTFSVAANNVPSARNGTLTIAGQTVNLTQQGASAAQFIPITPCRVFDTRSSLFGPLTLNAGETRNFNPPVCGVPSSAAAYSLNVTVVPQEPLGYLTIWPSGQPRPLVSTLNSFDGQVTANAAIVPAGASGLISVFVTDKTDVILDINGYFTAAPDAFPFYPLTPCRVADTRNAAGPFGAPSLAGGASRDFVFPASGCSITAAARAYSVNATVVPQTPLGYLTLWPAGQTRPLVSTLNSFDGAIVANAALVPAGTGGAISVYVTNATDVVLDINGYFGAAGATGALSFYPVAPCRVSDTRLAGGAITAGSARDFSIAAGACGIPPAAGAYSLNVTAVPSGPLGYLTLWPTGQTRPWVSTLNALDGQVTANAAIVPAGTNGSVSVFVYNTAHVILDINGYFAP